MVEKKKHDEQLFENNLMPKLIKEYQKTGERRPFDLEMIRRSSENGGFWTKAWEDIDLQSNVDALVRNGLIEDLGRGLYQISEVGILWERETTSPGVIENKVNEAISGMNKPPANNLSSIDIVTATADIPI
jgi:hypothetical protein